MQDHKTAAVLVCAGSGSRMKGSCADKLLLEIAGKPVVVHTIEAYDQTNEIDLIVIVTREENCALYESFKETFSFKKPIIVVSGGSTRTESVLNGVKMVPNEYSFVAIGDGARPLIRCEDISKATVAAWKYNAAALGVFATDTIKEIENGKILRTIPRENLINIQTPQIFQREEFLSLAEEAVKTGVLFTDDASIYEYYNKPVQFVEGHRDNLKITVPEDAALIKILMEERQCE